MNRVVVLLSSYNGEKYIKTQVDSILNQQGIELELVIRDDGSKDGTIEILRKYNDSRIKVIEEQNCGCCASFFKLLNYAQKHYDNSFLFAFSDQDDFWLPDKMFVACEKLKKLDLSKPSLYISNLNIVDNNLEKPQPMNKKPIDLSKSHALIQNHATGCTMLFNKVAIDGILNTNTSMYRIHDIPMFIQCLFLGNVVYDHTCHILYRQHENNVIGAGITFRQRLNSKLQSIINIKNQHQKEDDARILYYQFAQILKEEDRNLFKIIINYRYNLKYRICLLLSPKFRRQGIVDNIFFKLRVIIGHL